MTCGNFRRRLPPRTVCPRDAIYNLVRLMISRINLEQSYLLYRYDKRNASWHVPASIDTSAESTGPLRPLLEKSASHQANVAVSVT